MVTRLVVGTVAPWEIALAIGLLVVAILVALVVAAPDLRGRRAPVRPAAHRRRRRPGGARPLTRAGVPAAGPARPAKRGRGRRTGRPPTSGGLVRSAHHEHRRVGMRQHRVGDAAHDEPRDARRGRASRRRSGRRPGPRRHGTAGRPGRPRAARPRPPVPACAGGPPSRRRSRGGSSGRSPASRSRRRSRPRTSSARSPSATAPRRRRRRRRAPGSSRTGGHAGHDVAGGHAGRRAVLGEDDAGHVVAAGDEDRAGRVIDDRPPRPTRAGPSRPGRGRGSRRRSGPGPTAWRRRRSPPTAARAAAPPRRRARSPRAVGRASWRTRVSSATASSSSASASAGIAGIHGPPHSAGATSSAATTRIGEPSGHGRDATSARARSADGEPSRASRMRMRAPPGLAVRTPPRRPRSSWASRRPGGHGGTAHRAGRTVVHSAACCDHRLPRTSTGSGSPPTPSSPPTARWSR